MPAKNKYCEPSLQVIAANSIQLPSLRQSWRAVHHSTPAFAVVKENRRLSQCRRRTDTSAQYLDSTNGYCEEPPQVITASSIKPREPPLPRGNHVGAATKTTSNQPCESSLSFHVKRSAIAQDEEAATKKISAFAAVEESQRPPSCRYSIAASSMLSDYQRYHRSQISVVKSPHHQSIR